eukprot:m.37448 g.37448  ORF g.37448 m.37448 type:complete len:606 (-) comp11106_c0_seq1:180-1997(-)
MLRLASGLCRASSAVCRTTRQAQRAASSSAGGGSAGSHVGTRGFHATKPHLTLADLAVLQTLPAFPKFSIVDSTLREGEQFSTTEFTSEDRVYIAKLLDKLGVDYIEMVNPKASTQAAEDCSVVAGMRLSNAKILTHTRCHMDDVTAAVSSGVHGVNLYMATSKILREHSHGKGIEAVIETASEVIRYVKDHGLEVRFSCEDTFRSDMTEILSIYKAVDALGVDRVGIADTVGIATPLEVMRVISAVRGVVSPDTGIEFHVHNDTGCCVANALVALQAGATHIDTCVLGIGERNGITPLGGLLARMYTIDKEAITSRFDLKLLRHLERYVASAADIEIPFNNYITGTSAFTHKAGVHSKAVMANPSAYEIIDPTDFGVDRNIQFAHRLTGWNAISHRAKQLNLEITDSQIKTVTSMIKNLADERSLTMDQVDSMLMRLGQSGMKLSSDELEKRAEHARQTKSAELEAAIVATQAAVKEYETAVAHDAIKSIRQSMLSAESQPTLAVEIEGHLFDKAVINRIMDLVVDAGVQFEIVRMEVPPVNEASSSAVIQVWAKTGEDLEGIFQQMQDLVEAPTAECTLREISLKDVKALRRQPIEAIEALEA